MIVDFFSWSEDECFRAFCEHFGLEYDKSKETVDTFDFRHSSNYEIADKLKLDLLRQTEDVSILCRHITTAADGLASIKENGLLTLTEVLSNSTPLSDFLNRHGIVISPSKGEISINATTFPLDGSGTNVSFALKEQLGILHSKLYYDRGEVEFFVAGDDEELSSYGSIQDSPEILFSIDRLLGTLFDKPNYNTLSTHWSEQSKCKRYWLQFEIPIHALEMNISHDAVRGPQEQHIPWMEIAGFSEDGVFTGQIPICFYQNVWLADHFLSFYSGNMFDNIYGQLYPEHRIAGGDITVYKEEEI